MCFTPLHLTLGIIFGDVRFACSCSAMETHSKKLPLHSFVLILMPVEVWSRDLHSNATGCSAGQLLMGECGCWREETCVCAGCGRVKLFAGLPQNRSYLNIKCLKHINCYLSVAQKQKEQIILTLKGLTCAS